MLLSLERVGKSYGASPVLENVTAKIEDGARIGLVGINGAGKSTLLEIIAKNLSHDAGDLAYSDTRIGYLRQNSGLGAGRTVGEEMLAVFEELLGVEAEMRVLEDEIAQTAPEDKSRRSELSARYGGLQAHFEQQEGYNIGVKINTVLNGMGFLNIPKETPVDTLSGGERTRLAICKLLLEAPGLLILDEPTNHLDFKTLTWLEEHLAGTKSAILAVSHDRYFLDRLCTSIWELEHRRLTVYNGNYSRYVILKEERITRLQKEYEAQQEEIAKLKDFVARNLTRASTTARAQSRRRTLEKMTLVEKPKTARRKPKLRFEYKAEPVKDVLSVQNLSLAVGDGSSQKTLFNGLNLELSRGEKIAMIGANGVGKSSFLKAVLGLIPSSSGHIEWGKNTEVSYFEQDDFALGSDETALNAVWNRFPREYEHRIRTVLGNVGLTGENVLKRCSELSGGERARLKFAILTLHCGNVLFMDEPTNHLDLATKDALDAALREYKGSLLVVSHDRYLLNQFPDKIAELHEDGLTLYSGNYDAYLRQRAQKTRDGSAEKSVPEVREEKTNDYYRSKKQRSEQLAQKRRIDELENAIAALEKEIFRLENDMASDEIASDYAKLHETCGQLELKQSELEARLSEWAALTDQ